MRRSEDNHHRFAAQRPAPLHFHPPRVGAPRGTNEAFRPSLGSCPLPQSSSPPLRRIADQQCVVHVGRVLQVLKADSGGRLLCSARGIQQPYGGLTGLSPFVRGGNETGGERDASSLAIATEPCLPGSLRFSVRKASRRLLFALPKEKSSISVTQQRPRDVGALLLLEKGASRNAAGRRPLRIRESARLRFRIAPRLRQRGAGSALTARAGVCPSRPAQSRLRSARVASSSCGLVAERQHAGGRRGAVDQPHR
jgi:hypothetical protein